jgi:hypothetical protein
MSPPESTAPRHVALEEFIEALVAEESEFTPFLAADNLGLMLRAAINELDWFQYNIAKMEEPTQEQEEQFYLLRLGVSRLIRLILEARSGFDVPTVMFRRNRHITLQVLELASGLGMIEHGRRVAQSVRMGMCRIEKTAERDWTFTLPPIIPDEGFYERSVSEHYRSEARRHFSLALESEFGRKLGKETRELLTELVYPFREHFIGYDADPVVDAYFFGLATHQISTYDGYDTFHYKTTFGGVSFQKYMLGLTFLISLFLKHEQFAEALVRKVPTVHLENVLTISSETTGLVESIRDAVNYFGAEYADFEEMTPSEARRVFEVLSISRKYTALLSRPGGPIPLIVQCSDQDCIRCATGAGPDAVQFLLESLRFHFPDDYNQHQRSRERSMQLAMKRVLNEVVSGLSYLENIRLKLNGQVLTDVDMVLMEEATGTVVLCQLKHQELYGGNLHSQQARAERLRREAEKWIFAVDRWLKAAGEAGLRRSLRLPKAFPTPSVYRLALARHHAYPLREMGQKNDLAYANWIQFVNVLELMKKEKPVHRVLADVFHFLKKYEAPKGMQEHLTEPRSRWIIRDVKFTIQQEGNVENV